MRALSPAHPAQLALGLGAWCAWFVVVYGALSVGCAVLPSASLEGVVNPLNLSLLAITLATTFALAWCAWRCWRAAPVPDDDAPHGPRRFICRVSAGAHLVAAVATLVVGLPVLAYPPCV